MGMNKEGGVNVIMADNGKGKPEVSSSSGHGTSMGIYLPNCKANIEGHGEATPVLLPVSPMPTSYSPSQPQGIKAGSQITGAKKRKLGCVRRFVHPKEEVKKAMDVEVVDSTEAIVASTASVNTANDCTSTTAKEEVYITKILKPVQLFPSSSPATDNIKHVSITFKALRSDGTQVLVNNKELKATNPLLLVDFYEQHLRYTPDP